MKFNDLFLRVRPYSADEVDSLSLPLIEVFMTLVVSISNRCLSFGDNLCNKGALIPFAVREEYP